MTDAEILRHFSLESITLWEASLERGSGSPGAPGRMENRGHVESVELADGQALITVGVTSDLKDDKSENIVTVRVSFLAIYDLGDGYEPSTEDMHVFVTLGVLFQVHPFIRETISSLTGRAGLPPAFLPILVRDDATSLD